MLKPCLRQRILLACLGAALLAPAAAKAADITVGRMAGNRPFIRIAGPTVAGDDTQFLAATEGLRNALVVFSGPGGHLRTGLEIGRAIRARRFSTAVEDGQLCASACALAWLAGTERHMSPGSRIGFHAAYRRVNGTPETSGAGNALVGAYLAGLGLPERAIIFVTATPPSGLQLLDSSRAAAMGIAVSTLAAAIPAPPRPVPPREAPTTTAVVQPPAAPEEPPRPPAPMAPSGRIEGASRLNFAELRGRRIPLPPGRWIEAYGSERLAGTPAQPYVQAELLLVQTDPTGVSGWLLATVQDFRGAPFVGNWGRSDVCDDAVPAFGRRIAAFTEQHQDCAAVAPLAVAPGAAPNPLWQRVNMLATELPEAVPTWVGRASFRHARNDYAMTLRYDFDLSRLSSPDGQSRVITGPAREAPDEEALARLARWSEASADTIRRGMNRRLVSALPSP